MEEYFGDIQEIKYEGQTLPIHWPLNTTMLTG